jgi:hypothetical protein
MKKITWIIICHLAVFQICLAQHQLTQNIRGVVLDADAKTPLSEVTIRLAAGDVASISDTAGNFFLPGVPAGRQTLLVSRTGYEDRVIADIMVSTGKEVALTITMVERISLLGEVEVKARKRIAKPLNEFSMVSARSFSVEDTRKYPASVFDPARMAMNFPGVSANGDFGNEIIVRGNSPKGILWRLEGIEIPSPNHFSSLGAGGGGISMLSSSTLGTSDFFTAAFPAEYGNAMSGVFDLNLRNGNTQKREYAFMMGALGIEASAEGYFKKDKQASYLVNYRYSTLGLLNHVINDMGSYVPEYQDLSFKLNLPTLKLGTFSIWGLGGKNKSENEMVPDSSKWDEEEGNFFSTDKGTTGIAGISHQIFLNPRSYIKSIFSASYNALNFSGDTLNIDENYRPEAVIRNETKDIAYRANVYYNNKLSSQHSLRVGIIASHLRFDYSDLHYDEVSGKFVDHLSLKGYNNFFQSFFQWKYRVNASFSMTAGIHGTYFDVNNTGSIEPRVSLQYKPNSNNIFSFATGMHARPENMSTYYFQPEGTPANEFPNKGLAMPKALHTVAGYEHIFKNGLTFKAEAYYQYLYNVGVEAIENSEFSLINQSSFWDLYGRANLVSTGAGRNAGLDLSLERSLRKGLYYLITGSIFSSEFRNYSGNWFNTRFNRGYQSNWVAGKEWKTDASGRRVWGANARVIASGGLRNSPIDLEASKLAGERVPVLNQYFTDRASAFFRFDISFSYKINRKNTTHTILLDLQNVTNHQNLFFQYYDNDTQTIKNVYQMGLVPVVNYRIEF